MTDIFELNGKIYQGGEWDEICIDDECVASAVDQFNGMKVKLRYYISNNPIDKEKAIEQFLKTFYEGISESDDTYMCGSSWTGVYGKNDEFTVGGHDINAELAQHIGKYCYLIIENK